MFLSLNKITEECKIWPYFLKIVLETCRQKSVFSFYKFSIILTKSIFSGKQSKFFVGNNRACRIFLAENTTLLEKRTVISIQPKQVGLQHGVQNIPQSFCTIQQWSHLVFSQNITTGHFCSEQSFRVNSKIKTKIHNWNVFLNCSKHY